MWRLPIRDEDWWLSPVDDLMLGDKLHFPNSLRAKDLLLRVRFSAGGCSQASRCRLPTGSPGRWCAGMRAVGGARGDGGRRCRHPAGGSWWTFTRHCQCDSTWLQDGSARTGG
ncbi:hypothetical protein I552_9748 [Mycobacterium xenopi 3993]|nr:hypothetical protein I552_9748 [Mycobacterium xenopi 3993]